MAKQIEIFSLHTYGTSVELGRSGTSVAEVFNATVKTSEKSSVDGGYKWTREDFYLVEGPINPSLSWAVLCVDTDGTTERYSIVEYCGGRRVFKEEEASCREDWGTLKGFKSSQRRMRTFLNKAEKYGFTLHL